MVTCVEATDRRLPRPSLSVETCQLPLNRQRGRLSSVAPLMFVSLLAQLSEPRHALAQHEHPVTPTLDSVDHSMHGMIAGALGISHARMGSGTTWVPDVTPMRAIHGTWRDWSVMLHGVAFLQYDRQYSRRGDDQLGLIDWEMLMLMRRMGVGLLHSARHDEPRATHHWRRRVSVAAPDRRDVRGTAAGRSPASTRPRDGVGGDVRAAHLRRCRFLHLHRAGWGAGDGPSRLHALAVGAERSARSARTPLAGCHAHRVRGRDRRHSLDTGSSRAPGSTDASQTRTAGIWIFAPSTRGRRA